MTIEEDFQAWEEYPQHRWLFNKLELALQLGYDAGPTGTSIKKPGYYIVKPTYNLYGMGIGAKRMYLDPEKDGEDMINLAHVPPGYFWCEYFEGPHYSIDYFREYNCWVPFSFMVGTHRNENDLVQFDRWKVVDKPNEARLPISIRHMDDPAPVYLNAEFKGSKLFEVHLRSGNDHAWNFPVGTVIYPVWKEDYEPDWMKELPFVDNLHEDSFMYSAHGNLDHVRLGYRVKFPEGEN